MRIIEAEKDVTSIAFAPHSQVLACGTWSNPYRGEEAKLQLWDVATGELWKTLKGHKFPVFSIGFASNGASLITSGVDDVRVWDIETGEIKRVFKGEAKFALASDNTLLATGNVDTTTRPSQVQVKLRQAATGELWRTLIGCKYRIQSLDFTPDNKMLATAECDNMVRLWDMQTGELVQTAGELGHTIRFSPTGTLVAALKTMSPQEPQELEDYKQLLHLWDAATWELQAVLTGLDEVAQLFAFAPDGSLLACGVDNTVKLWEMPTGKFLKTLQGHTALVGSVAFSPDGQLMASASRDGTIRLWLVQDIS